MMTQLGNISVTVNGMLIEQVNRIFMPLNYIFKVAGLLNPEAIF
jgi:hypothetical protein